MKYDFKLNIKKSMKHDGPSAKRKTNYGSHFKDKRIQGRRSRGEGQII